jgi:hypothetical protein
MLAKGHFLASRESEKAPRFAGSFAPSIRPFDSERITIDINMLRV